MKKGIIKQTLTIHNFFSRAMDERGTLRAGYIWAIIKASLFLLLYSFLTFMCGWLYKYYDLWILPWLPAWLLIIIPNIFFVYFLFKYFFLLPHKNICDIMRVSYDIMNVSSGHFSVWSVESSWKFHFVISDDDVSESVQEVNDIS